MPAAVKAAHRATYTGADNNTRTRVTCSCGEWSAKGATWGSVETAFYNHLIERAQRVLEQAQRLGEHLQRRADKR